MQSGIDDACKLGNETPLDKCPRALVRVLRSALLLATASLCETSENLYVQGLTVEGLSSILSSARRSTVDRVAALEEENRSVLGLYLGMQLLS